MGYNMSGGVKTNLFHTYPSRVNCMEDVTVCSACKFSCAMEKFSRIVGRYILR